MGTDETGEGTFSEALGEPLSAESVAALEAADRDADASISAVLNAFEVPTIEVAPPAPTPTRREPRLTFGQVRRGVSFSEFGAPPSRPSLASTATPETPESASSDPPGASDRLVEVPASEEPIGAPMTDAEFQSAVSLSLVPAAATPETRDAGTAGLSGTNGQATVDDAAIGQPTIDDLPAGREVVAEDGSPVAVVSSAAPIVAEASTEPAVLADAEPPPTRRRRTRRPATSETPTPDAPVEDVPAPPAGRSRRRRTPAASEPQT